MDKKTKKQIKEEGVCPYCGEQLEPIYENNGFTPPNGPPKWEIIGWRPCECEREVK
jgi:hypothetical protein